MYFNDDGFSVGKKIYSKPYKSLYESAHRDLYHYGDIDGYIANVPVYTTGRSPVPSWTSTFTV